MNNQLSPLQRDPTDDPRRILLVEDEFLVRLIAAEELRDAGLDVIEAADGDEAIGLLATDAPIDLVISDVSMPGGTDGLQLLAHVKQYYPLLPFILVSAHLGLEVARARGANDFLGKPYTLVALLASVSTHLQQRPSTGR